GLFPLVVVISLPAQPGVSRSVARSHGESTAPGPSTVPVAAALENALHTLLALTALDENRGQGRSRIVTRDVAGGSVATLDRPVPFAYAVDRRNGRLVLGTSPGAVARCLAASSDPRAGQRYRELQAAAFREAQTFLCVDLDALTGVVDRDRNRLVRIL